VVSDLFGDPNFDPIGQKIQISQITFKIMGVLEPQGNEGATNKDDKILIPITTSLNRIFDKPVLRNIYVSAKSSDLMEQAQFDIQKALRVTHHLSPQNENDFQISSQTQILSTAQNVTSVMTALLSGIAAISLVVGGIGIMNIMLVSVTERTREIGIRKAIGATRNDILRQFLIESVTLSVRGAW
jgi:putative ABC transport system permease protein